MYVYVLCIYLYSHIEKSIYMYSHIERDVKIKMN